MEDVIHFPKEKVPDILEEEPVKQSEIQNEQNTGMLDATTQTKYAAGFSEELNQMRMEDKLNVELKPTLQEYLEQHKLTSTFTQNPEDLTTQASTGKTKEDQEI